MEAFEYLSVLISIVLGLGITHLLMGFGRWVEARGEFQAFGPSLAWAGFLLLVHIETWWTMFGYTQHQDWTFLEFVILLLQPMVLFLLTLMVFPSGDARRQDLKDNFFHQRPWFFGLFVGLLTVSIVKDLVLDGALPEAVNLAFHGVFLAAAITGIALQNERGHRLLAYSVLVVFLVYTGLLFFEL
ncbi:MAG: hypothetical protein JSU98_12500 [Gemmatimonadales bacterium]|jgi:hypothetical protein|nr:MAG: hypothetical protein JSU98_12500 [Gemmatimonadales bacterium]